MATYLLRVVQNDGTLVGNLDDADIDSLSWELNGVGAASWTLPVVDPDALHAQPAREVQIVRDGTVLWWGPIVRVDATHDQVQWQAAGIPWYFDHRFMGRADRVNRLTNGDFEAGETGWGFAGGVTHSVDTGTFLEGTQSLRLSGSSTVEQYAHQTYTHATQSHPDGDYLTLSGWLRIDSASYVAPPPFFFGLYVEHFRGGERIYDNTSTINDDTTQDDWLPFEFGIPAVQAGDTVEVRLYAPQGAINWDLVTLTAMESLSFWPGADVADIVAGIVDYAQDNGTFTHGKSDLNVATAGAATGVERNVTYQFAEHRNIGDALAQFTREGVLDASVEITAATRTYTTHHPTKGSLYGSTLTFDTDIAAFRWQWDGEQAATSVVMLGPGDGPDRPEGGATDPAALGGLTLEHVEQSPDDTEIGALDSAAAGQLAVKKNPEILEVTGYPGAWVGAIDVGDRVPVQIDHGYVQVDATYRVVRMELSPRTDQLTLTLNAAP